MGYWDDGHMDGGWGIAMMLGMIGFWVFVTVVVVLAIVWAVRSPSASSGPPTSAGGTPPYGGQTRNAEQILAERLARGDIDPEDYQRRLDALTARNVQ